MHWGTLHPRVILIGMAKVVIDLPPCAGNPARQIEMEEVHTHFENVSREIIPNRIGYRFTFILRFDALKTADMANIMDILNHTGSIKLQPWIDKDVIYDVVRLDPELDMNYNNDRVTLAFQTVNVLGDIFTTVNLRNGRVNRFGGIV